MPAASLRTQKAVASQATTWQQQPSGLVFSNLTTLEKPMSLKVARAPSRELVALLEGTDEALDGLEGLGEVRKACSSCSWHLFSHLPPFSQGDLCQNQRCPTSGNPRPRRGGQPQAGGHNNRWGNHQDCLSAVLCACMCHTDDQITTVLIVGVSVQAMQGLVVIQSKCSTSRSSSSSSSSTSPSSSLSSSSLSSLI